MVDMEKGPGYHPEARHSLVATTAGQRSARAARWARHHLEALEEPEAAAARGACSRWHAGPHRDFWHCAGMDLGFAERQAAGAVHPWRVSA